MEKIRNFLNGKGSPFIQKVKGYKLWKGQILLKQKLDSLPRGTIVNPSHKLIEKISKNFCPGDSFQVGNILLN
jgi:hypothetical protein